MWRFLSESVEGTSHRGASVECQDSSFVTPFASDADAGLVLACADGAGSAREPKVGSRLACETAVRRAMQFLEGGRSVGEATPETIRGWVGEVRQAVAAEAESRGLTPRDLACTLLLAVVGREAAAFAQMGDGGIVVLEGGGGAGGGGGEYRPVFWPQTGEYQNTTYFVTEAAHADRLQVEVRPSAAVTEVALFSDGLQMLALDYAARAAHQPFFRPIFASLRGADDPHDLIVPMRQWLDSDAVNRRTDDDKTLILAARG